MRYVVCAIAAVLSIIASASANAGTTWAKVQVNTGHPLISHAVFWQLNALNAAGQITDEQLGPSSSGMRMLTGFDLTTGLMTSRQSGNNGSTTNLQNLTYQWDANGNLDGITGHPSTYRSTIK